MNSPLFSILIPTLAERRTLFASLYDTLRAQIAAAHFQSEVEILELCDNREASLGAKRNELMRRARGEFIAFVDDDDHVSDRYISLIHQTLCAHPDVDCLGITGIVYFRGSHPHKFVYSASYDHYFSRDGVYYRPAYMLNPMRRRLAQTIGYAEVSYNEDQDWAMRAARARLLRHEIMVNEILYHYFSQRRYPVQWAIDVTEPIRRPLGLQSANRLRLRRWLENNIIKKQTSIK